MSDQAKTGWPEVGKAWKVGRKHGELSVRYLDGFLAGIVVAVFRMTTFLIKNLSRRIFRLLNQGRKILVLAVGVVVGFVLHLPFHLFSIVKSKWTAARSRAEARKTVSEYERLRSEGLSHSQAVQVESQTAPDMDPDFRFGACASVSNGHPS